MAKLARLTNNQEADINLSYMDADGTPQVILVPGSRIVDGKVIEKGMSDPFDPDLIKDMVAKNKVVKYYFDSETLVIDEDSPSEGSEGAKKPSKK